MHALIIDDDKNSLFVLSQMLRMEGIDSTIVNDPTTLEDVLGGLPAVNIVFLDLEMPDSNGYQILEQLRADSRFENVPIVACSVYTDELNNTYQAGFNSFVAKPIDADRFPGQLRQILGGQAVWRG